MSRRPSAFLRRVLVDTSAYYALADQDEPYHRRARAVAELLAWGQAHLFTTNYVVAETHALLVNRLDRSLALTFVRQIYGSATTVVRVSPRDEDRAWAIIEQFDDKDFTVADATSFAVMQRLRISAAFTFDSDFAQYGFPIVSAELLQG